MRELQQLLPAVNSYHTGNTETLHREMHVHMENASNGEMCSQYSDDKFIYRWIKNPQFKVTTLNEILIWGLLLQIDRCKC